MKLYRISLVDSSLLQKYTQMATAPWQLYMWRIVVYNPLYFMYKVREIKKVLL